MRKQLITLVAFGMLFTIHQASAQTIQDLDFLIGEWNVKETVYPGTEREWTEEGTRVCEYYLDGSFIKCEAQVVSSRNGKTRTYAYLINYNSRGEHFLATSLANDFPLHGKHNWYLNKEEQSIIFATPQSVNGDRFFRGTLRLVDDGNKLIWEGWSNKFDIDREWEYVFEDVAIRKK